MFLDPSPRQPCRRASALHRPIDLQLETGSWRKPAQCPMISARHSVPPSERKGRFDICQLQRPAMMVEYRTALYWKASRFRVGSALRQLRGHDGGRTEHQRHEQDRRANRPRTAWERTARTVPFTCHYRTCATVCFPHHAAERSSARIGSRWIGIGGENRRRDKRRGADRTHARV